MEPAIETSISLAIVSLRNESNKTSANDNGVPALSFDRIRSGRQRHRANLRDFVVGFSAGPIGQLFAYRTYLLDS
jgi:hypothetical protein